MLQTWSDLLFLHWEVNPSDLQSRLPNGLFVDTFEGKAYVGIVPFFMENIRIPGLPAVPRLSQFLELNLRTYVYDARGHAGVWFFSLDANQRLGVSIARVAFSLPYYFAEMEAVRHAQSVYFTSRRQGDASHQTFHYPRAKPEHSATEESLEFFLLERYSLFAQHKTGRLIRGRIWHRPYQFTAIETPTHSAELFRLAGLPTPSLPPTTAHVASRVEVEIYAPQRI
jgi:uncharacterized protein YqjF (DUF2071 family)